MTISLQIYSTASTVGCPMSPWRPCHRMQQHRFCTPPTYPKYSDFKSLWLLKKAAIKLLESSTLQERNEVCFKNSSQSTEIHFIPAKTNSSCLQKSARSASLSFLPQPPVVTRRVIHGSIPCPQTVRITIDIRCRATGSLPSR